MKSCDALQKKKAVLLAEMLAISLMHPLLLTLLVDVSLAIHQKTA
jgi:hypothetical protein